MKNINILLLLSVLLFAFSACSDSDDSKDVKDIEILGTDNDTIYLMRYEQHQLEIKTDPKNADVKYVSNNANVFTISSTGLITAVNGGYGDAIVVAPNGELWTQSRCVIAVTALVDSIAKVAGDKMYILDAPLNVSSFFTAYPRTAANRALTYVSSAPAVASVDENGVITPLTKGVAEIRAKSTDGGEVLSEPIIVYSGYTTVSLDKTGWDVTAINNQNGYPPAGIIDGSNTAGWSARYSPATPPPYWILIDMKDEKEFNKFTIYQHSWKELKTVKVMISPILTDGLSQDDPSFTEIGTFNFNKSTTVSSLLFFPETTHRTRYIKLYMPDSNYANGTSMGEIYVESVE